MRPVDHLTAVSRRNREIWKLVERTRLSRGVGNVPEWPDWCFLPGGAWLALTQNWLGHADPSLIREEEAAQLAALGSWRYSQGIYRFHPEIFTALVNTELTGILPADVLTRLPEWCVYVETPGLDWKGYSLHGFWAHLEWDLPDACSLRLLADTEGGLKLGFLEIGPWPLSECIGRYRRSSQEYHRQKNKSLLEQVKQIKRVASPSQWENFIQHNQRMLDSFEAIERLERERRAAVSSPMAEEPEMVNVGDLSFSEAVERFEQVKLSRLQPRGNVISEEEIQLAQPAREEEVSSYAPLVSLLLYLCSSEPEFSGPKGETSPHYPQPSRVKGGWRLFPAAGPKIWQTGQDTGERLEKEKAAVSIREGERKGPAPHLRRAHWHGFWLGPKKLSPERTAETSPQRKFEYRWLPPIFVQGSSIT